MAKKKEIEEPVLYESKAIATRGSVPMYLKFIEEATKKKLSLSELFFYKLNQTDSAAEFEKKATSLERDLRICEEKLKKALADKESAKNEALELKKRILNHEATFSKNEKTVIQALEREKLSEKQTEDAIKKINELTKKVAELSTWKEQTLKLTSNLKKLTGEEAQSFMPSVQKLIPMVNALP